MKPSLTAIMCAALLVASALLTVLPLDLNASAQNSADATPDAAVAEPYRAKPLTSFTSISTRPLFVKERRRGSAPSLEIVEDEDVVEQATELNATLLGVLRLDNEMRVLTASEPEGEAQWRLVGDRLQGWEVSEIFSDRAIFVSGSESKTIYLYEPNAPGLKNNEAPDENISENK